MADPPMASGANATTANAPAASAQNTGGQFAPSQPSAIVPKKQASKNEEDHAHRMSFFESVKKKENAGFDAATNRLAKYTGKAVAVTFLQSIVPRVAVSMFICGMGWWAVKAVRENSDKEVNAPTVTYMAAVLGGFQSFMLVQWALRGLGRWWEARGHLGSVAGTLHLLAVQLSMISKMKKSSENYMVNSTSLEMYCGLLQCYMPLLIKKVHPCNVLVEDGAAKNGWKDLRTELEQDLLPDSLLKHISAEEAKDLETQGYALVSHWLYILVEELAQKRILGYMHSKQMFQNLETLHLSSMAVEKIHNTPMPDLMRMGTAISVYFYCYLCFPMVLCLQVQSDLTKWPDGIARYIILFILIVIYFVVIQLIMILFVLGIHFEDPYGDDAYDLPLIPMVNKVDMDINSVFYRGLNRSIPNALLPQLSDEARLKADSERQQEGGGAGAGGYEDGLSDEEMD